MEKLELKHLAPYLPFGLRIECLDFKKDYVGKQYDKIVGLHQWDKTGVNWCVLTEGGSKPSLDSIKLILHPLSDLTKEIEVNGEKFVPVNRIKDFYNKNILEWDEQFVIGVYSISLERGSYDTFERIIIFGYDGDISHTRYDIVQMLLEWHFDVFGLIEKGLAVDINTLEG